MKKTKIHSGFDCYCETEKGMKTLKNLGKQCVLLSKVDLSISLLLYYMLRA